MTVLRPAASKVNIDQTAFRLQHILTDINRG